MVCARLRTMLRAAGFRTAGAMVGDVARARKVPAQRPVSVLLLDSNLPGEDGRTALTTLRHEFPDTAFIGLSGDSAAGKVQAAMAGGAPGVGAKPFAAENVCCSIGPALPLPVDQAPMAPAAGGRPIPPDGRHVARARSRATRGYNSPA